MAQLRKRNSKKGFSYVIDFRFQGKRHVLSVKTTDKRLAERVKEDLEAKITLGKFNLADYRGKEILLSEFFKIYLDGVQGSKMESTLKGERIYTNTFLSLVGDLPLRSITTVSLDRWRYKRLETIKPVTYNDERRVLSHVFNKAIEYGYLQTNPFKMLKKIREQEKRLYMTSDEVVRFFDAVDALTRTARNKQHREGYRKFKLFCEVLLSTGMRRSELLNLEPNHIDLKTNILRVEQAKGKKRREIPMTGKVREIMMALTPVLFRDMTKDQVTHKFTDCARGMGLKGMKLHSLRHTFGTYLIAMGYDITVAKELLGHEDIKTTMIYAKADTRLIRDAIRSFDVLENNGYKMVTKGERGIRKLLKKNPASSTGEPTIT